MDLKSKLDIDIVGKLKNGGELSKAIANAINKGTQITRPFGRELKQSFKEGQKHVFERGTSDALGTLRLKRNAATQAFRDTSAKYSETKVQYDKEMKALSADIKSLESQIKVANANLSKISGTRKMAEKDYQKVYSKNEDVLNKRKELKTREDRFKLEQEVEEKKVYSLQRELDNLNKTNKEFEDMGKEFSIQKKEEAKLLSDRMTAINKQITKGYQATGLTSSNYESQRQAKIQALQQSRNALLYDPQTQRIRTLNEIAAQSGTRQPKELYSQVSKIDEQLNFLSENGPHSLKSLQTELSNVSVKYNQALKDAERFNEYIKRKSVLEEDIRTGLEKQRSLSSKIATVSADSPEAKRLKQESEAIKKELQAKQEVLESVKKEQREVEIQRSNLARDISTKQQEQRNRTHVFTNIQSSYEDKKGILANKMAEQSALEADLKYAKRLKDEDKTYLSNALARYASVAVIVRTISNTVKKSVSFIQDLDKALVQIATTTKMNSKETWELAKSYNALGQEVGKSTTEIADAAAIFFRQGKTKSEVNSLMKSVVMASAIEGTSMEDTASKITSALNAYKLEASEAQNVTSKFAAVGSASATDFGKLSYAMTKVGAGAEMAGLSMDHLLGLLATDLDVLQEAPENIGTSWKTIVARFGKITKPDFTEGATDEDGEPIYKNKIEEALSLANINLTDKMTGQMRELSPVLDELGPKWKTLDKNTKNYLATTIAGTRQSVRFIAAMENYDKVMKLTNVSANSAGEILNQYAIYEDSVAAGLGRLKSSYEEFLMTLNSTDALKTVLGLLTSLLKVASKLGALPVLGAGVATFLRASDMRGTSKAIKGITNRRIYENEEYLGLSGNQKVKYEAEKTATILNNLNSTKNYNPVDLERYAASTNLILQKKKLENGEILQITKSINQQGEIEFQVENRTLEVERTRLALLKERFNLMKGNIAYGKAQAQGGLTPLLPNIVPPSKRPVSETNLPPNMTPLSALPVMAGAVAPAAEAGGKTILQKGIGALAVPFKGAAKVIGGVTGGISGLIGAVGSLAATIGGSLVVFTAFKLILSILSPILKALGGLFKTLGTSFVNFLDSLKNIPVVGPIFKAVADGIKEVIPSLDSTAEKIKVLVNEVQKLKTSKDSISDLVNKFNELNSKQSKTASDYRQLSIYQSEIMAQAYSLQDTLKISGNKKYAEKLNPKRIVKFGESGNVGLASKEELNRYFSDFEMAIQEKVLQQRRLEGEKENSKLSKFDYKFDRIDSNLKSEIANGIREGYVEVQNKEKEKINNRLKEQAGNRDIGSPSGIEATKNNPGITYGNETEVTTKVPTRQEIEQTDEFQKLYEERKMARRREIIEKMSAEDREAYTQSFDSFKSSQLMNFPQEMAAIFNEQMGSFKDLPNSLRNVLQDFYMGKMASSLSYGMTTKELNETVKNFKDELAKTAAGFKNLSPERASNIESAFNKINNLKYDFTTKGKDGKSGYEVEKERIMDQVKQALDELTRNAPKELRDAVEKSLDIKDIVRRKMQEAIDNIKTQGEVFQSLKNQFKKTEDFAQKLPTYQEKITKGTLMPSELMEMLENPAILDELRKNNYDVTFNNGADLYKIFDDQIEQQRQLLKLKQEEIKLTREKLAQERAEINLKMTKNQIDYDKMNEQQQKSDAGEALKASIEADKDYIEALDSTIVNLDKTADVINHIREGDVNQVSRNAYNNTFVAAATKQAEEYATLENLNNSIKNGQELNDRQMEILSKIETMLPDIASSRAAYNGKVTEINSKGVQVYTREYLKQVIEPAIEHYLPELANNYGRNLISLGHANGQKTYEVKKYKNNPKDVKEAADKARIFFSKNPDLAKLVKNSNMMDEFSNILKSGAYTFTDLIVKLISNSISSGINQVFKDANLGLPEFGDINSFEDFEKKDKEIRDILAYGAKHGEAPPPKEPITIENSKNGEYLRVKNQKFVNTNSKYHIKNMIYGQYYTPFTPPEPASKYTIYGTSLSSFKTDIKDVIQKEAEKKKYKELEDYYNSNTAPIRLSFGVAKAMDTIAKQGITNDPGYVATRNAMSKSDNAKSDKGKELQEKEIRQIDLTRLSIEKLNLALERQSFLMSRYAKGSKEYQQALQNEIRLLQEKQGLTEVKRNRLYAQLSPLEKSIIDSNVPITGYYGFGINGNSQYTEAYQGANDYVMSQAGYNSPSIDQALKMVGGGVKKTEKQVNEAVEQTTSSQKLLMTRKNEVTIKELDKLINKYMTKGAGITGKMIMDASKKTGINAMDILANIGAGSKWAGNSLAKNKHNYYNINAYATKNKSVYENASGWKTVEGGVIHGAEWLKNNFVAKDQTTFEELMNENHKISAKKDFAKELDDIRKKLYADLNKKPTQSYKKSAPPKETAEKIDKGIDSIMSRAEGIGMDAVEGAVQYMQRVARDDRYGYDQSRRWEQFAYDCSSLVIRAFKSMGFNINASTTHDMSRGFQAAGFSNVAKGVNLNTQAGLQRGDILLSDGHTAVYLGNGKIVHARKGEPGHEISGGKLGDQTGHEIEESNYYRGTWHTVLRKTGYSPPANAANLRMLQQLLLTAKLGGNLNLEGEIRMLANENTAKLIDKINTYIGQVGTAFDTILSSTGELEKIFEETYKKQEELFQQRLYSLQSENKELDKKKQLLETVNKVIYQQSDAYKFNLQAMERAALSNRLNLRKQYEEYKKYVTLHDLMAKKGMIPYFSAEQIENFKDKMQEIKAKLADTTEFKEIGEKLAQHLIQGYEKFREAISFDKKRLGTIDVSGEYEMDEKISLAQMKSLVDERKDLIGQINANLPNIADFTNPEKQAEAMGKQVEYMKALKKSIIDIAEIQDKLEQLSAQKIQRMMEEFQSNISGLKSVANIYDSLKGIFGKDAYSLVAKMELNQKSIYATEKLLSSLKRKEEELFKMTPTNPQEAKALADAMEQVSNEIVSNEIKLRQAQTESFEENFRQIFEGYNKVSTFIDNITAKLDRNLEKIKTGYVETSRLSFPFDTYTYENPEFEANEMGKSEVERKKTETERLIDEEIRRRNKISEIRATHWERDTQGEFRYYDKMLEMNGRYLEQAARNLIKFLYGNTAKAEKSYAEITSIINKYNESLTNGITGAWEIVFDKLTEYLRRLTEVGVQQGKLTVDTSTIVPNPSSPSTQSRKGTAFNGKYSGTTKVILPSGKEATGYVFKDVKTGNPMTFMDRQGTQAVPKGAKVYHNGKAWTAKGGDYYVANNNNKTVTTTTTTTKTTTSAPAQGRKGTAFNAKYTGTTKITLPNGKQTIGYVFRDLKTNAPMTFMDRQGTQAVPKGATVYHNGKAWTAKGGDYYVSSNNSKTTTTNTTTTHKSGNSYTNTVYQANGARATGNTTIKQGAYSTKYSSGASLQAGDIVNHNGTYWQVNSQGGANKININDLSTVRKIQILGTPITIYDDDGKGGYKAVQGYGYKGHSYYQNGNPIKVGSVAKTAGGYFMKEANGGRRVGGPYEISNRSAYNKMLEDYKPYAPTGDGVHERHYSTSLSKEYEPITNDFGLKESREAELFKARQKQYREWADEIASVSLSPAIKRALADYKTDRELWDTNIKLDQNRIKALAKNGVDTSNAVIRLLESIGTQTEKDIDMMFAAKKDALEKKLELSQKMKRIAEEDMKMAKATNNADMYREAADMKMKMEEQIQQIDTDLNINLINSKYDAIFTNLEDRMREYQRSVDFSKFNQSIIEAIKPHNYDEVIGAVETSYADLDKKVDFIKKEREKFAIKMNNTPAGTLEWKILRKKVDELDGQIREGISSLVEQRKKTVELTINREMQAMERGLLGGRTLKELKRERDKFISGQEKELMLKKLNNRIERDSLNLSSEQAEMFEKRGKLRRAEVEQLNKELDIQKMQQDLDKLKVQKTRQVLRKRDDGSINFAYEADQDAINKLEDQLLQAQVDYQKWLEDSRLNEIAGFLEDIRDKMEKGLSGDYKKYSDMAKDVRSTSAWNIDTSIVYHNINTMLQGYERYIRETDRLTGIQPVKFDTGGYTGDFEGGKLAVLHRKELVLNAEDTQNLLDAIRISNTTEDKSSNIDQLVIQANFPNATNAQEIKQSLTYGLLNEVRQKLGERF